MHPVVRRKKTFFDYVVLTSLPKVASQDILFIRHSVMLLDWSWVDQVFMLISNVPVCVRNFVAGCLTLRAIQLFQFVFSFHLFT